MKVNSEKDKTIIFTASHLYLFWTTGVYYLWELSRKYKIVLIVDSSWEKNQDFQRVCNRLAIVTVLFVPKSRNPVANHRTYSRLFKKALQTHRPGIVFQHNYRWTDNQYLYYWTRKLCPESVVLVYTNGQMRMTPDEATFGEARAKKIQAFSKKYKLPEFVFRFLLQTGREAKYILDNYLIPLLVIGKPLRTWRKFPAAGESPNFDSHLVYHSFEKTMVKSLFKLRNSVVQIRHPLESCHEAVNEILYGLKEGKIVSILPSAIGFESFIEDKPTIDKWIEAISILQGKLNEYDFFMKLHPRTERNPDSEKILSYIRKNIRDVTVIDCGEKAEKLIIKSKVVVGDVSTSLWFADSLKSKIVISLDIKDFAGSDDMKHHENIFYLDSLEKLRGCDLRKALLYSERQQCLPETKYPTLLEFLACLKRDGDFPD